MKLAYGHINRNVRLLLLVLFSYAVFVLPLALPRPDIVLGSTDITPHWDERSFFYFSDILLNRGIYTLQLTGSTQEYLELQITGDGNILVHCDLTGVPVGQTRQEARIHVKQDRARIGIDLFSKEESEQFIPADIDIRLTYRPLLSVSCHTVYFLFVICAATVILLLFRRTRENEEAHDSSLCLYALILLTVFLCAPYLRGYTPQGPDTPFHLSRIVHIAEEISSFRIPPRFSAEAYSGYGYPVSIFYGGLFLVFPATLYLLGVPLWLCYNAFVCLIFLAAVAISFVSFRAITRNKWYGLLFTAVYAGSHRLIHNQLERAAIGESAAMAFMPLVLLGVFLLLQGRETERRGVLCLVAGFTGLIQSHILSTSQVSLFLSLFCLAKIKFLVKEKKILPLVQAARWTSIINLWFLVPFLDYYLRHSFKAKDEAWQIANTGIAPVTLLLGGGSALILLLVADHFLICRIRIKEKQRNTVLLFALSLLALFLASDYMPWLFLEETLPVLHKILGGYLQFASRWLSISTGMICALSAYILSPEVSPLPDFPDRQRKAMHGILLAILAFSLTQGFSTLRNLGLSVPEDERITVSDGRYYLWDEQVFDSLYLLTDVNWVEWVATEHTRDVLPGSDAVTVSGITRNAMNFRLHAENAADEEGFLVFPVWNYYGYVAESDGTRLELSEGDGHLIRVSIPPHFNGELTMGFREPWYWRAAEIASLAGVILFLGLYHRRRKR